MIKYEIREQIETTKGNRMETTKTYPDYMERTARLDFIDLAKDHPHRYFELVKVETNETCLKFTKQFATDDQTADLMKSETCEES